MKDLLVLVQEALDYAADYAKQYEITDEKLFNAIFVTHLAWLLNLG